MNTTPEREIWADNIRLIATIGVILLHVSSTGLYEFRKTSAFDWMTANLVDSITRCCVPLFFMLSGALLLSKTENAFNFYRKRFSRVIIPFLFWSLIFNVAFTMLQYLKGHPISISVFFTDLLFYQGIFSQQAYHLWYIYVILGLYILTPLIKSFLKTKLNRYIFIGAWIISIILCLPEFQFNNATTYLLKFVCYTGYFGLGHIISQKKIILQKKHKITLLLIAISLISFTALGTLTLSNQSNTFNDILYDYYSPNIILFSVIMFLLIKTCKKDFVKSNKILNKINHQSYGIYLSHVLFLSVFERVGFDWNFLHPLIAIPLVSTTTLSMSLILISTLSLHPTIRKLSTGH